MKQLTNFFKILSDETRLRILMLLMEKELCVCEIHEVMDESQPKISKHLAKLRDNNLIIDERKEKYVYYSLDIEEELYMHILNEIRNNIDKFPLLKDDQSKIEEVTCRIRGK
ncbi:metalloregulator ArsR/SmtB family transcription factor [Mycoplasmatota bacterium WC44]